VTEVEDQLMDDCGSCYAFSALGAVESRHFIKTGNLLKLSKQEIVDCSYGNQGCGGGSGLMTYNYLIDNGISLESDYKYEAKEGDCKKDVPRSEVKVFGYVQMEGEDNLKKALVQGPVKVLMNAKLRSLNFYKEGIYDDSSCTSSTNHAVLAVGYGRSDEGIDFWIVKNSWSEDWGEKGYIRIAMGQKVCGFGKIFYYPLLNEIDAEKNEINLVLLKTLAFLLALVLLSCCIISCCFFLCRRCCRQRRSYQC
jgi:C1A family cysteine protease